MRTVDAMIKIEEAQGELNRVFRFIEREEEKPHEQREALLLGTAKASIRVAMTSLRQVHEALGRMPHEQDEQ